MSLRCAPLPDGSGLVESLPANVYYDPEIYQQERTSIFRRHWSLLAREAQLSAPGRFVAGEIAGWPVFVIRGRDGALKAFHNLCRHRAGPMVRSESGSCALLRCAYHGWVYDLDGDLKKAPGFDRDPGFDKGRFGLLPIRVESWRGLVFVCLDSEAPALEPWLGDIVGVADEFPDIQGMEFEREIVREASANWKTYGDNSAEGYHLPLVHRELAKATPTEQISISPYENGQFVGFRIDGYAERGQESRAGRGFWVYKFPGLLLHFSETGFNVERVEPVGPGRIRLTRWFWFTDQDSGQRETAIQDSLAVMEEDMRICEEVQRNLGAGVYDSGQLSPETEAGTIFVQSLVKKALGASA